MKMTFQARKLSTKETLFSPVCDSSRALCELIGRGQIKPTELPLLRKIGIEYELLGTRGIE